jgi:internalin A
MSSAIWDRFEKMLAVHAPRALALLNPPATAVQIGEAEHDMGVFFPDDIRAAYLRHDGALTDGNLGPSCLVSSCRLFYPMNWWASLSEMVQHWHMKREVSTDLRRSDPDGFFPLYEPWWDDLKVKPVWWNEKWMPIGLSETPSSVYFDLDPAPKGTIGQLIKDGGMQEASVIATSLNHYLEMLIDRVERKVLVFGDGWELADPDQSVYGAHGFDWNQLP